MKYLFFLGHPAHFHLFKNTIRHLNDNGDDVRIFIKKKDILEELLNGAGLPYTNTLPNGRTDGTLGIIEGVLRKEKKLYTHCRKYKPDMMIGTSAEIAHVGRLFGIPSVNFVEDDYSIIRSFGIVTYPFTDVIMSPVTCNNGRWNKKTVFYHGYHKLAYLHPKRFERNKEIAWKYVANDKPYYLLRFAKLNAHHDSGIRGIDDRLAIELVNRLKRHGNIYITSERELPGDLEKYRLMIDVLDIHHVLAYADLLIGDSQSMSVEAAMLGTPSIRFSDFSGRIGVLEELEKKYGLGYGIRPDKPQQLLSTVDTLLATKDLRIIFAKRRDKMLQDKIDVTGFLIWFIQNYPDSREIMRVDPGYQFRFR
jgi:uncharacterized protein